MFAERKGAQGAPGSPGTGYPVSRTFPEAWEASCPGLPSWVLFPCLQLALSLLKAFRISAKA